MNLVLSRVAKNNDQVVGLLNVVDRFNNSVCELKTLELPWLNNAIGKSCIPCGTYEVVKRWSIRYGYHFWITNVTNRSMILIHSGNFFNQTRGCILVGVYLNDSNRDNNLDVCQSKNAIEILDLLLPQSFNLKISEQWSI